MARSKFTIPIGRDIFCLRVFLEIRSGSDYMDSFASHRRRCQRLDRDSHCQGRLQIPQVILSLHSLEVGNSCQYPFRLSGYLLFLWLLITLHLAGAWSDWVTGNTTYGTVVVVYTIAPIIILVSVYARVRYVLVKHMPPASELINLELQAFENEKSHLMLVIIMFLLSVCSPALYLSSCYHRTHNGISCFTCLLLLL